MTWLANWGLQSEMIDLGSPWFFHMWCKYNLAMSRAMFVLLHGIKTTSFQNLLTTTRTQLSLSDYSRSVMKSTDISTQRLSGIDSLICPFHVSTSIVSWNIIFYIICDSWPPTNGINVLKWGSLDLHLLFPFWDDDCLNCCAMQPQIMSRPSYINPVCLIFWM